MVRARYVNDAWLRYGLIGILTGCQGCPPDEGTDPVDTVDTVDTDDTDKPEPPREVPFDEAPDETFAVDELRLIAHIETEGVAGCPPPENPAWTVGPLFGPEETDPELLRYCLYERTADDVIDSPFSAVAGPVLDAQLVTVNGVALSVSHDHVGLGPAAIDVEALNEWFLVRFDEAAGVPRRQPPPTGGARRLPAYAPQTRLVLLDGAPTVEVPYPDDFQIFGGPAGHGTSLASLAQLLTCVDNVECPVEIFTVQVLGGRRTAFNRPPPAGAGFGTVAQLAQGIRYAVRRFGADGQRGQHLVLNLSVAWHPFHGGGMPGAYTIGAPGDDVQLRDGTEGKFSWSAGRAAWAPDVRAVFDALNDARCAGALTFAAVGNGTSGPAGTSGPLLPAGWESYPADLLPDCVQEVGVAPLVVAVGGVEPSGEPLAVSRPDSQPALVAMGDHAWYTPQFSDATATMTPMTGTSVSTVVASTAAAAIWTFHSTFTADDVLAQLMARGQAVGEVSSWAKEQTIARYPSVVANEFDAPRSRMIRACDHYEGVDAVSYACKIVDPPATPLVAPDGYDPAIELVWPGEPEQVAGCGDADLYRQPSDGAEIADDPCPNEQYFGPRISPWVLPQPDTRDCGACFLDPVAGVFYVDLANIAAHRSLAIQVRTPTKSFVFSLPNNLSSPTELRFQPSAAPSPITSVLLGGILEDRAVVYPILVLP